MSRQGDSFAFHGRGWGHGVGLCQKGAAAMAQQGRSAQEILQQYFPGTQAADEASGREWNKFAGDGFVLESLDAGDAAYLPDLNRARAEATERSGLHATASFTVRAFASTPAFRQATLAPGWVAAFTEGDWIGTQPLRTLAARRLLADTMRHEFLHALVEQQAGPRAPLWLREGLVEVWSEQSGGASSLSAASQDQGRRLNFLLKPSTMRWRTRPLKRNRQPRIAQPSGTQRNCSRAMGARKCSSGSSQAFPPESSPPSGNGSLTESSPSGPEPTGARTSESSSGFSAARGPRDNSTAHQARSRTHETIASK